MRTARRAKLLRIHCSEADRFEGKPLYEAIVDKCREMGVAGATVFEGLEGFGETAELHRGHVLHSDRPIVLTIVDTGENVARIMSVVEPMLHTGAMAVSDVESVRVEKSGEGVW